jgi:hypothetical protein
MAQRVMRGEFGNGQARRNALGADYDAIQAIVDSYYATGGMVSNYLAIGGFPKMRRKGTDTIPAMLTPGEFVIKKSAVDKIGYGKLAEINSGRYAQQEASSSVYNINVQAQTDANPEDIARVVMQKISSQDRIRAVGNRF